MLHHALRVSTLAGPVDDLADEVTAYLTPRIKQLGSEVVDDAYQTVVARFIQDKDMLAEQVVEAARPKVKALVAELVADPELQATIGAAKEELKAGFVKSIIATSVLAALGATFGVWLVMRKS